MCNCSFYGNITGVTDQRVHWEHKFGVEQIFGSQNSGAKILVEYSGWLKIVVVLMAHVTLLACILSYVLDTV